MLHYLLLSLFVWYGFWTMVLLPYSTAHPPNLTAIALIEVSLGAALFKLRRGSFRAASWIYLAGVWLFATVVGAQNGGIRSVILSLYVTLPVSAAWLLGYTASLGTAVVCSGAALVFAVLEMAGVRLPVTIPGTAIGIWIHITGAVLMSVIPLAQVLRTIRASERKYRRLHESITDAVAACDMAGKILETNPAYEAMLGYTSEELRRLTYQDLTPERWHAFEARIVAEQVIRLGHSEVYEKEYRRRDGTVFPVELRTYLLRGESNQAVGMWAIVRDITQRKQAAETLRLSEQKFATLFQCCPVSITVSDLNDRDRFIEVNEAFETYTGYRRQEVVGRTYPPDWLWVDPAEYAEAVSQFTRNGKLSNFEFRFRQKGGAVRTGILAAESIEVDGRTCVVATTIDITDLKLALEALTESKERFRLAQSAAHLVAWDWDLGTDLITLSGRYAYLNGLASESNTTVTYEQWLSLVHQDDREQVQARIREALERTHVLEAEFRVEWPDGTTHWLLSKGTVFLDDSGRPVRAMGVSEEITEHKYAEEALRLERIGTLANGIAHDFNNLLGAILAQAELALSELAPGSHPEEELQQIQDVAIQGGEIVRQLMIYAGKESEEVELIDVSRIVSEMAPLLKVSVSKHAALETDLEKDLPAVRVNAAKLRQVVMNLVANASQAIGDRDGVIRLATGRSAVGRTSKGISAGDYVQLEVSDTGEGMPLEIQARMFDPFFTTKSAGHGLGLSVVQGIVRNLRGAIHVASEPGKGTTFQVLLPCAEAGARATVGPTPRTQEASRPSQQATVLVVEDEDPLRQAVAKMLRNKGFEVLEVGSGSAAIDLLRKNGGTIDVMLLDMTIPGASSREVVAQAAQARPDLKVILTSAYSEETVMATMSSPVIRNFIRKPFQLGDLLKNLQDALSS